MFSSKRQLQKRTPDNGTDRENFLSLLVDEYLNSVSYDAKCQVLANLANFAYDPVNYTYIRDVGVLDIFIYVVNNEKNEKLLHFASSGICNLCLDPINSDYILQNAGLKSLLLLLLESNNTDTLTNIITTLIFICNDGIRRELTKHETVQKIKELEKSEDKQLSNLATIFLEDVCQ